MKEDTAEFMPYVYVFVIPDSPLSVRKTFYHFFLNVFTLSRFYCTSRFDLWRLHHVTCWFTSM